MEKTQAANERNKRADHCTGLGGHAFDAKSFRWPWTGCAFMRCRAPQAQLGGRRCVARGPVARSRSTPHASGFAATVGPSCTASAAGGGGGVGIRCRSAVETVAADPHGTPPPCRSGLKQSAKLLHRRAALPRLIRRPRHASFLFLRPRQNLATRAESCRWAAHCAPASPRGVSSLKRLTDLQCPTSLSREQVPPPFRCCGASS